MKVFVQAKRQRARGILEAAKIQDKRVSEASAIARGFSQVVGRGQIQKEDTSNLMFIETYLAISWHLSANAMPTNSQIGCLCAWIFFFFFC